MTKTRQIELGRFGVYYLAKTSALANFLCLRELQNRDKRLDMSRCVRLDFDYQKHVSQINSVIQSDDSVAYRLVVTLRSRRTEFDSRSQNPETKITPDFIMFLGSFSPAGYW